MNNKKDINFLKILNGNFISPYNYTYEEVKSAFSKTTYNSETKREKLIYNKFFQDCHPDDLKDLCNDFEVNIRDIKKLYISSPYRKQSNIAKPWNKRFKLKHYAPEKITPRTHKDYTDIDKFKTYELTPCIAYEMAIRNKEVKEMLERIDKVVDADIEIIGVRTLRKSVFAERNNIDDKKELDEKYLKYLNYIHKREAIYKKFIKEDYKKYIDNYLDISTEYCSMYLPDLQKQLEDELINEFLIYPKGYYRDIPHTKSYIKEQINNEKTKLETYTLEENDSGSRLERIVHDEFILYQGLYAPTNADADKYMVDNIVPNFKRQVNDQNQTHIPINFALPLDEIVDYVTKIKKKINPRSLREFLDKKLEKADNLTKMNISNKEDKFDATRGENPQFKLADMIYIYDMKQLGFSNTEIQYALYKRYPDKSTHFEDKTIAAYYSLAKNYIENKKYQELITGKPVV